MIRVTSLRMGSFAGALALMTALPAGAQITLIDSPATINSPIVGNVRIGSINPDPFTVKMVDGGVVTGVLSTRNQSSLLMQGGRVENQLQSRHQSILTMSGGFVGNPNLSNSGLAFALDSSTFNFKGGVVQNQLQALNNATLNWSGGTVGGAGIAMNNSVINFSGGHFTGDYTLQMYDTSTITMRGGGLPYIFAFGQNLLNFYGSGLTSTMLADNAYQVTGTLLDGKPLDLIVATDVGVPADFRIVLNNVPEPGAVTLLGSMLPGAWLLRRRRFRAHKS